MGGRRSLVEEVRQSLLTDITSGAYQVGDRLPNEQEMAERFDVSRATVRDAYRALIDAGHLSRRHGTGTFVTALPHRHALDINLSYTAMIEDAGYTATARVIDRRQEVADESTRDLLGLEDGEKVAVVERIRYADQRPVVFSVDRIPMRLIAGERWEELGPSMFRFLEGINRGARNGRARILPVIASAQHEKLLDVAPGAPLLFFEEVDYDGRGQPVLTSQEWHTSDLFEMWINRRGGPTG